MPRLLCIAGRAALAALGILAALVWVCALGMTARCAVAPAAAPTPDRPLVGCIASSPLPAAQLSRRSGNRLLPEIVRIIGVTSPEDGERWMVVRGVYVTRGCVEAISDRRRCDWQPWPREEIQFGAGCGPEASAFLELQRRGRDP